MSDRPSSHADWPADLRVIRTCMAVWTVVCCGFWTIPLPRIAGILDSDLGFRLAQPGATHAT